MSINFYILNENDNTIKSNNIVFDPMTDCCSDGELVKVEDEPEEPEG